MQHFKDIIPAGIESHQFTYTGNQCTEDTVSIAHHTAWRHLQLKSTMLFVDFNSAFNTVILDKPPLKLHNMVLSTSMCSWIKDFLTGRPQVVRIRDCISSTVCSAQLSHDCSVIHCSNTFVKFADTTIEGLMSDNETIYKEEPLYLPLLCLPLQQRSKPGVKMNPGSI